MRFHSWCPPEAAFCAADELGLYLSIEMPMWLNHDVCALELGEDSIHRSYFLQEALTISKTYGNHPSFILFSNGNETMGDFDLLCDITTCVRAYDNRRLYTLTSNFDHPVMPCEDYFCAYEAYEHPVRIQTLQDETAADTHLDYTKAVSATPVPIISFEIGQYCVYPNVRDTEKYTGNILPTNLEIIKKDLLHKNLLHKLNDYIQASGSLAVKLYKEDIEAALRTTNFGGFGLLSLCDYTGQSTASIGILNAFWDSKEFIAPSAFRQFCSPVVPLFKSKRIFTNTDILDADLALYDFGDLQIQNPEYEIHIYNGSELFYHHQTKDTHFQLPLTGITKSCELTITVRVLEYTNEWHIFVFVPMSIPSGVRIIQTREELNEIIKTGGRGIVTANCFDSPMEGSFIPVFWSPVHFPSEKHKPCGAIIDASHPLFENFPTGKFLDYQWKSLFDHSKNMDISSFSKTCHPLIETVPNFFDNTPASPLFEIQEGNADLLFCGFDLERNDVATQCFKACVYNYMLKK